MMGSPFHREEQSQQSGSRDASSHKSQVNEAVIKFGLRCSMKVSSQVALVEGQHEDKVSLDSNPVSGGNRLV